MRHLFVWKLTHPDPEQAKLVLNQAMERAMKYNRNMTDAEVEALGDHCIVRFKFHGRDRWWINSRARNAIVALAVRARVSHRDLELLRIERVDTGHDLRGKARTPAQQEADYKKTAHARWARVQATRDAARSDPAAG